MTNTHPIRTWLLDFEETLATGRLTLALQHAIPKFIHEHQLKYDEQHLANVMVKMQELSRQKPNVNFLLHELFEQMHWPQEAKQQFWNSISSNVPSILFDDSIAFLERLKKKEQQVFVVSNNPRTPENIQMLRIENYIDRIFTPQNCPDTQPKPHPSLWEYISTHEANIDPQSTVVVGDDPWSDGAFADTCKLPCWIVDRLNRFSEMQSNTAYFWVQTLLDIPV